jgi:sporulation protein YlmC with PRC-barrel domain
LAQILLFFHHFSQEESHAGKRKARTMARTMLFSDEMCGTRVLATGGESLGFVDELLIEPGSGRIASVVISSSPAVPGVGGRYITLPWSTALKRGKRGAAWVLDREAAKGLSEAELTFREPPVPGGRSRPSKLAGGSRAGAASRYEAGARRIQA